MDDVNWTLCLNMSRAKRIEDILLDRARMQSAAAARNARRRMRRAFGTRIEYESWRCYGCLVHGSRKNHKEGHWTRSRMNPNRTTWGKSR